MRRLAILNQKGGVGKTTTAANLGAALALRGRRVLLVDLDPQGNLTDHLGVEAGDDALTVYDVLTEGAALADAAVATGTEGLHLVPSHEDLAGVELELASQPGRESRLRRALDRIAERTAYDYVLVDCPPSLGLLSLNAMVAVDEIFVALQTEYFALRGMTQLQRIVEEVRAEIHPGVRIAGILPTLVDPVTNLAREVIDEVRKHFGDLVFQTRIRKSVRLAEAPGHQLHVFDYAPDSSGAADYRALAEEVEARAPAARATPPPAAKAPAAKPPPVAAKPAAPPAKPPAAPAPAAAKPPVAAPVARPPAPKPAPAAATPPKAAETKSLAPRTPTAIRPVVPPAATPKPPSAGPAPKPSAAPAPGGRTAPVAPRTPPPAPGKPVPPVVPKPHPPAVPPKVVPKMSTTPATPPPKPSAPGRNGEARAPGARTK
jgi:chromosome partitioning protein